MIFPAGQNSTGWMSVGLALIAVVTFFLGDYLGTGGRMMSNLACAGSTLLAFFFSAFAHIERNGRLEAARSALIVSVSLIVYYMVVSVF